MTLGSDELRALDRLLDQALDLDERERARWLDSLGPEFASLAPVLRRLLARDATHATGDVMSKPPPVAHLAAEIFADAAASLTAGTVVGPYRLLRELGTGGMGVVWLAERTDALIERPVALKLPLFSLQHRAFAERFARERVILARLAHPNIARLYDAGIAMNGQPYLALEYVQGEPLTEWCDARRCTLRERVELVVQVLRAVQYAHANLVIHRDLKPSNILVTAAGEVRLLDFGIAKMVSNDGEAGATELTRLAGRALTPAYAAPELLTGAPISIASDVYSIGVILYELLVGVRPYRPRDESPGALEAAVIHDEAPRPSLAASAKAAECRGVSGAARLARLLAGDLDTIALKALRKQPEQRYPTAAALAEDLERQLRGEAIEARAESALYRTAKLLRRHAIASFAAAITAIALVAGTTIAMWQAREARREAARANAVQNFVVDLFRANSVDQPDPLRARQTTARQLLDLGSARIARSLGDQPEVRLAMLQTLATLYAELGLWSEASDLARTRTELARSLYGAEDLRVAAAIADQVPFLDNREQTSPEKSDALIREALRIYDANDDHASRERAQLHERASVHYLNASLSLAIDHAERAVEIYRSAHPNDPGLAKALGALADTQQREGKLEAALATYEEALQVARRVRLPEHELLYFLRRVGEKNAFLDRGEEAEPLLREALAMSERINGSKHPDSIAIRSVIARNLAWMSRLDEAAEVAAQVIADTLSERGHNPSVVRDNYRMMFDVYWTRRDLAAAREGNAAALATYEAPPPDTFVRGDLLMQRALIETAYGRPRVALAALAEAEAIGKRLGLPRTSHYFGNLTMYKAQVLLAGGDAPAARSLFTEQLRFWRIGDEGFAGSRAELSAGLVEALLALGEVEQARLVARDAEDELAQLSNRSRLVGSDAQVQLAVGRVHVAQQSWERALSYFQRASELFARVRLPDGPDRAEAEALRALCLARLSRPDEANAAMRLARAAEARHGPLGEPLHTSLKLAESAIQASATGTPPPGAN